jgi:hypothetical protein
MKVGEIWKPKQSTLRLIEENEFGYAQFYVDPEYGINRDRSRIKITHLFTDKSIEYISFDYIDTEGYSSSEHSFFIKHYERDYSE